MNSIRAISTVAIVIVMTHAALPGLGQEINIVSPKSANNVDGDEMFKDTGGPGNIQYLHLASDFNELPETHQFIEPWAIRGDVSQDESLDWIFDQYQVWMSTTESDFLVGDFDENNGGVKTLVFDGTLVSPILGTGVAGGPNDFGNGVPLHEPFFYDPRSGKNLLVEVFAPAPSIPFPGPIIDAHSTDDPQMAFSDGNVFNVIPVIQFTFVAGPSTCDVNSDGTCDVADIDAMTQNVLDGVNTPEDRDVLITSPSPNGFHTFFGDSNLDGEFNSSDFVQVLQSGEYDDAIVGNSSWATGDWNGDREFNSADFLVAFRSGSYEQGPRAELNNVPEPASFLILSAGLVGLAICRHR